MNTLQSILARIHIPLFQTDLFAIGSWGTAFVGGDRGVDFHQLKYCTRVICLCKGVFFFGELISPCGIVTMTQFQRENASENCEQISSVPSLWLLMPLLLLKFWFECRWVRVTVL